MKQKLNDLISKFGVNLTKSEYNQYIPKLRDYLVAYITENKSGATIENILRHDFTRTDVIKSTVHYVDKNYNVRSKSAVDDYLIALNRFFEETIYKDFPNHNLITLRPFTSLSHEVDDALLELGVKLNDRIKFPSISEDQYRFILEYLNNETDKSFKTKQIHIIIKLFLLYGFSFDRIIKLRKSNYYIEERVLEIEYQESPKRTLLLEVPAKLHNEIMDYLHLIESRNIRNESLFVNTKGKSIKHDFPTDYFLKIREAYLVNNEHERESTNPFTPTGLAKFAIIRLILEGVNQSVITDLTGFQSDVFSDCQDKVNEIMELNRNRYINHKIRGIITYDEI